MIPSLLAALLLPLAFAGDLALDPTANDIRLGRVHARVEQYRRGELALPVPDDLLPTVELASQLGAQLYRLDAAALDASAALTRAGAVNDPRLQGWLCVDGGEQVHVLFVGLDADAPDTPGALYHATVDLRRDTVQWLGLDDATLRDAPPHPPLTLAPLGADLQREWQAHQAVLRANPSAADLPLDPVVVQVEATPGSEAYLVFLLARGLEPEKIQLGGHAAFMVRFKGDKLGLKPFAIARDAMSWDRRALARATGEGEQFAGFYRSTDDVPVPRELHVYESLVYQMPFILLAEDNLWHIEGVTIRYLGRVE